MKMLSKYKMPHGFGYELKETKFRRSTKLRPEVITLPNQASGQSHRVQEMAKEYRERKAEIEAEARARRQQMFF